MPEANPGGVRDKIFSEIFLEELSSDNGATT